MNRDLTVAELIDAANLGAVLQALSEICASRGETDRTWATASGVIGLAFCDLPMDLSR